MLATSPGRLSSSHGQGCNDQDRCPQRQKQPPPLLPSSAVCSSPYHLHFTPTHSSWLNQIERWFALLSQRQIKRSLTHGVKGLETAISQFIQINNADSKSFQWTKSVSVTRSLSITHKFCGHGKS